MSKVKKGFRVLSLPLHNCNSVSATTKKLPFYFVQLGQSICDKNHCVYYDNSPYFTILLTLEGGCNFIYRNKQITISKGDIVFYDSHEPQYFDVDNDDCWNYLWINFYGASAKVLFNFSAENGVRSVPCKNFTDTENIFYKLVNLNDSPSIYNDISSSCLIHKLIMEVLDSLAIDDSLTNYAPSWIQESVRIIHKSYNTPISISELAAKFHISESHFVREFKKYTGFNPYNYVIYYRISESKKMLVTLDKSIDEIAFMVGFNNTSNFIRKFKNIEGITPNNYRKLNA